jgi:hypothetical protein
MTDPENRPDLVRGPPRKVSISEDEVLEGMVGVCSECGQLSSPVEADAELEQCPCCYQFHLYGADAATRLGVWTVDGG